MVYLEIIKRQQDCILAVYALYLGPPMENTKTMPLRQLPYHMLKLVIPGCYRYVFQQSGRLDTSDVHSKMRFTFIFTCVEQSHVSVGFGVRVTDRSLPTYVCMHNAHVDIGVRVWKCLSTTCICPGNRCVGTMGGLQWTDDGSCNRILFMC